VSAFDTSEAEILCYRNNNVTRVGGYLAHGTRRGLGSLDFTCVGARDKYFFASERSFNVTRVGGYGYIAGSVKVIECNVTRVGY
jgi:hypothetical protein